MSARGDGRNAEARAAKLAELGQDPDAQRAFARMREGQAGQSAPALPQEILDDAAEHLAKLQGKPLRSKTRPNLAPKPLVPEANGVRPVTRRIDAAADVVVEGVRPLPESDRQQPTVLGARGVAVEADVPSPETRESDRRPVWIVLGALAIVGIAVAVWSMTRTPSASDAPAAATATQSAAVASAQPSASMSAQPTTAASATPPAPPSAVTAAPAPTPRPSALTSASPPPIASSSAPRAPATTATPTVTSTGSAGDIFKGGE